MDCNLKRNLIYLAFDDGIVNPGNVRTGILNRELMTEETGKW